MNIYKATVISVYDGDTFRAEVDLGFNVKTVQSFRLTGINAPEIRKDERALGLLSKHELEKLILGKEILMQTIKSDSGRSAHWLANVWVGAKGITVNINISAQHINEIMVESGYAKSTKK